MLEGAPVKLEGIDVGRQFDPKDLSAGWPGSLRAGREVLGDRLGYTPDLSGIEPAQLAQMMGVTTSREKLRHGHLHHGSCDAGGDKCEVFDASKVTDRGRSEERSV